VPHPPHKKFFEFRSGAYGWEALLLLLLPLAYWAGILGEPGRLEDPDCYMWLSRVEQLWQTLDWYNHRVPWSNAPFGETLHWTRLFDCLLLFPALLVTPLLGFKSALFQWGVLSGIALMIATLFVLARGALAIWPKERLAFLPMLFVSSPPLLIGFQAARPDHQCLNLLLLAAHLVCFWRMLDKRSAVHARFAGLVAGFSLYGSVESSVAIVIHVALLSILWIRDGHDWSRPARDYFSFLALSALCGFILHNPPNGQLFSHTEADVLSLRHLLPALLLALFGFVADKGASWLNSWSRRLTLAALAAFGSGVLLYMLIPGFWRGPYSQMDPRAAQIWMSRVTEAMPLPQVDSGSINLAPVLLGAAIATLAYLCWQIYSNPSQRKLWIAIALINAAYVMLALLYQSRWVSHAAIASIVPWSLCVGRLAPRRWGAQPLFALLLGCSPWILALLLYACSPRQKPATPAVGSSEAAVKQLCDWMKTDPALAPPQRVFIFLNFGPELHYRTSYEIISSPYHRNTAGILDEYDFMTAPDSEAALRIARARKATLLILPLAGSGIASYYNQVNGQTLYKRLLQGNYPPWLRVVELPRQLKSKFLVFRIDPNNC
jgi:hypothetical protein